MSKHTPWIAENNLKKDLWGNNIHEIRELGVFVAHVLGDTEEIRKQRAERIVTCVNAMEGLSNEQVINLRKDADLESEKRSVAFAEWKEVYTTKLSNNQYWAYIGSNKIDREFSISDLYRYFIQNIYQK